MVQQHTTPELLAAMGIDKEPDIPGATATGLRKSPLIFGMGLIDAVPDQLIRLLARIRYRDGVHGRAAVLPNGRVGRFSRKATTASLEEFNAGAYFNEMGVTNRFNPIEGTVGGTPFGAGVDLAPEPEIDATSLAASNTFVKLLGPVAPSPLSAETRFGRFLFYKIGCAECHIPLLRTGNSPVAALRFRWFRAYTDLLLHDLGQENADICNGVATPSEFRTQPLIGMQFVDAFMHDGASVTIQQAIQRHGGEGSAARAKFLGLVSGAASGPSGIRTGAVATSLTLRRGGGSPPPRPSPVRITRRSAANHVHRAATWVMTDGIIVILIPARFRIFT